MSEALIAIYLLPPQKTVNVGYICLAQFGERQRWWRAVTLIELEVGLRENILLDWVAVQQALTEKGTWSGKVPLSYEDAAKIHLV